MALYDFLARNFQSPVSVISQQQANLAQDNMIFSAVNEDVSVLLNGIRENFAETFIGKIMYQTVLQYIKEDSELVCTRVHQSADELNLIGEQRNIYIREGIAEDLKAILQGTYEEYYEEAESNGVADIPGYAARIVAFIKIGAVSEFREVESIHDGQQINEEIEIKYSVKDNFIEANKRFGQELVQTKIADSVNRIIDNELQTSLGKQPAEEQQPAPIVPNTYNANMHEIGRTGAYLAASLPLLAKYTTAVTGVELGSKDTITNTAALTHVSSSALDSYATGSALPMVNSLGFLANKYISNDNLLLKCGAQSGLSAISAATFYAYNPYLILVKAGFSGFSCLVQSSSAPEMQKLAALIDMGNTAISFDQGNIVMKGLDALSMSDNIVTLVGDYLEPYLAI